MTAINTLTKPCSKCGQVKNYVDFSPKKEATSGRASWCKTCNREAVNARHARQLADDPEGFRKKRRDWTYKSRAKPEVAKKQRLTGDAHRAAVKKLRENHEDEYNVLYRIERYERGLPV